jgi:hypothetical protein
MKKSLVSHSQRHPGPRPGGGAGEHAVGEPPAGPGPGRRVRQAAGRGIPRDARHGGGGRPTDRAAAAAAAPPESGECHAGHRWGRGGHGECDLRGGARVCGGIVESRLGGAHGGFECAEDGCFMTARALPACLHANQKFRVFD